jgi:hypothetical protein
VRSKKFETRHQKIKRAKGENIIPLNKSLDEENVNKNKKRTENKRPTTPPSLLGIERRIA